MKKYLVGGAVRDSLLHLPVKERDWVVVGATSQDMLIAGYQQVGKLFPVFLHPKSSEEYALARTEKKSGLGGYTGFTYSVSPEITLEQDLKRRDLTINAIARDKKGLLIDPYHGQKDIKERLLRHVSEAFYEDPLRVLRVARFAAKLAHLNFSIVPDTLVMMQHMTNELLLLSPERVWKETEKALLTHDPQIYFKVLRDCGALEKLFPEIDQLFSDQEKFNSNYIMNLAIVARLSDKLTVRFAYLCNSFGKQLNEFTGNYNNEYPLYGCQLVESFCKRLRVPNSLKNLAKLVINYNHLLSQATTLTPKQLINLFYAIDVWRRPERLEHLIIISEADARCNATNNDQLYYQIEFLREAYKVVANIKYSNISDYRDLNGHDIGDKLRQLRYFAIEKWKKLIIQ
ncbi:multifunctional CCA addition/repair protein [Candidatus Palibaumannia cicadellinicola]|uniref:CCA-adding enzyme n=1 Tax=Candidatus Palibaumannia cicadellinicola TaxID=186490 RepID=A0A0K2BLS6_9GAMM|nr:multifunctional CCA addition/repair protein [Candidatus Baumannia cicadellinicola]AKZ66142.1 tRNA nucleotidyltransferase [Candidatus Baumannia cicadellinicola]